MPRTQVAIVGAGPSGLLLSQLLYLQGIDSVVLERQSRAYVTGRIRAGVLEQGTVDLLIEAQLGDRMLQERLIHDGFLLAFADRSVRFDLKGLTGKCMTVYGQTEITKDLIDARVAADAKVIFDVTEAAVEGVDSRRPLVRYQHAGQTHELLCDFVAGCDGYHGVCRRSVSSNALQMFERIYPFAWLGILAEVPPVSNELIYSSHARGFTLCSMRSRTRSRYYLQCAQDEKPDAWSDERFWNELRSRLPARIAAAVVTGPSIEKSIAPLRSFVVEPIRFGRLFLVGDAAHIVPPTGAKGLNLAVADVRLLSRALVEFFSTGRTELIDRYSESSLRRTWKALRFSWWFTSLMHQFSDDPFNSRLQLAELDYLASSSAARVSVAENYIGLPFEAD